MEMSFVGTCFENSRPSCGLGSQTRCNNVSLCLHGKLSDVEASAFLCVNGNLVSERTTRKIVIRIYRVAQKRLDLCATFCNAVMRLQTATESGKAKALLPAHFSHRYVSRNTEKQHEFFC